MYVIFYDLISKIVQFYEFLETIKIQIEGLNAKIDSSLSPLGRFKVVVLIRDAAQEA
jgi:hypothetical protein